MGRLEAEPWLRAVLAAFAESVRGLGPVLDVGCGPGTVTAHLAALGLDAAGIDLSPRMVEHARRRYPELRFSVASATALDLAPASPPDPIAPRYPHGMLARPDSPPTPDYPRRPRPPVAAVTRPTSGGARARRGARLVVAVQPPARGAARCAADVR